MENETRIASPPKPEDAPPEASIVIVNYNGGEHLAACVSALTEQTLTDFEVVVVDNASNDNSLEHAIRAAGGDPRFVFDRAGANLGFAAGNNRGIARSRGSLIVTLNPDAFPERDWLSTLCAAASERPDVAMFGSLQLTADGTDRLDGAGDRYLAFGIPWRDRNPARLDRARTAHRPSFATFAPCAAAAAYRREAFEAVGGFDDDFFCYVEDVDLAFRLRLAGHCCLQLTDAKVRHVGGASSGGELSDFARFHGTRNLIWCFAKNMPGALLTVMLPLHLAALAILVLKAAGRGQAGTTVRAIASAWRGLPDIRKKREMAQAARTASNCDIAHSLDWNPLAYLRGRCG